MTCVVITRGGEGSPYRHASVAAADDHPLTQFGDAILRSADDVRDCYQLHEMSRLFGMLGDERRQRESLHYAQTRPSAREIAEFSSALWDLLSSRAQAAPEDPSVICQLVAADRRATRVAGVRVRLHPSERKRDTMSETQTTEQTAEKKSRPIPRTPKYSDATVITFGKNKEGASYGPNNNPKKVGSKAHEAFSKYTDGMTVAQAKEAGISLRDIDFDVGKGFIVLQ